MIYLGRYCRPDKADCEAVENYDTNAWACICHNLAYSPWFFSNSSWVPDSTTLDSFMYLRAYRVYQSFVRIHCRCI